MSTINIFFQKERILLLKNELYFFLLIYLNGSERENRE